MFDRSFPHIVEGCFQDYSRGRGAYQNVNLISTEVVVTYLYGKLKKLMASYMFKKLPISHNTLATPPATLKSKNM